MPNVLSDAKRLAVLAALVEGNSERAVSRMTKCRLGLGLFPLCCFVGELVSRVDKLCVVLGCTTEPIRVRVAVTFDSIRVFGVFVK